MSQRAVSLSTQGQRRNRGPPPRLSWPTPSHYASPLPRMRAKYVDGVMNTMNNRIKAKDVIDLTSSPDPGTSKGSTIQSEAKIIKRNSSRKRLLSTINIPNYNKTNTQMWVDKHTPKTLADLVVAPKKVKEVREWMESQAGSKCLILVGNPGVGKSTMVRLLAKELRLDILEWSEGAASHYSNIHAQLTTLSTNSHNQEMQFLRYSSPLDSFEEFLNGSGKGYTSLSIVTSRSDTSSNDNKLGGSIILIDEIPHLHGHDAEERFRSIFSRHILEAQSPTIFIYSQVIEGNVNEMALEKLIDRSVKHLTTIIQINCVTNTKMKKCLSMISKLERISITLEDLDEICVTSAGDVRSAIMTLQFQAAVPKQSGREYSNNHTLDHQKDARLSSFHALGKALYAKRQQSIETSVKNGRHHHQVNRREHFPKWKLFKWIDSRPPLDFDPEAILINNALGPDGSLSFLQYHCVEFFTDEAELSEALSTFSDAATFSTPRYYSGGIASTFPLGQIASLAGRAVADANKHPAPSRFRSLGAPKMFEARKKQLENKILLQQLCNRLASTADIMPLETCIGSSSKTFVTDMLPYLRRIKPQETDILVSCMHSLSTKFENKNRQETTATSYSDVIAQSQSVLKEDDIVDD